MEKDTTEGERLSRWPGDLESPLPSHQGQTYKNLFIWALHSSFMVESGLIWSLPDGSKGKKISVCMCNRPRLDPWVREDPLEQGMTTHSSILAWRIPWAEEPGGLTQSIGLQRVRQDLATNTLASLTQSLPLLFQLGSCLQSFPAGSAVKNLPANAGDTGLIPGSGRSLEEKMATHSSILPSEIPWIERPGRLWPVGFQRVRHDLASKQ